MTQLEDETDVEHVKHVTQHLDQTDVEHVKPGKWDFPSSYNKKYLAGEWKDKKFDDEVKRPEKRKRICVMKAGYEVPSEFYLRTRAVVQFMSLQCASKKDYGHPERKSKNQEQCLIQCAP